MNSSTSSGTRGARPQRSPGPFVRWLRQRMMKQHRRSGKFMGMDILFLTTVGRKSGERRETPVAWFPDGSDAWLIVASAAGAARNPDWYLNMANRPDQVWAEIPAQKRKLRVRTLQLEGGERQAAWQRITEAQPRFAKYQEKTDRVLPVIRLEPAAGDGAS